MDCLIERVKSKGIENLSDYDLLSLVVRETDEEYFAKTKLAEQVDISPALFTDLLKIKGVNDRKACAVMASLELGRRFYSCKDKKIITAADVYPLISHYADRKQEQFICLSLNGAHEVQAIRVVSVGILNKTLIHPREVFADPLEDRAAAIVIAHNHPSGQLEPSEEDRMITKRLSQAGELLGITLLDHLIISPRGGFFSFVESGIPF